MELCFSLMKNHAGPKWRAFAKDRKQKRCYTKYSLCVRTAYVAHVTTRRPWCPQPQARLRVVLRG